MAKSKSQESIKQAMPEFVEPMLAALSDKPFDSPEWLFTMAGVFTRN